MESNEPTEFKTFEEIDCNQSFFEGEGFTTRIISDGTKFLYQDDLG